MPQPKTSRFIVGIDLGTTNSVVAFVDTAAEHPAVHILAIPQLTAPGSVESRSALPSFLYSPADGEFPANALKLPWPDAPNCVVGEFARKRGTEVPARLIASAKSWLSHAGAERTAPILPWSGPEDVPKMSPVSASAQYLAHMRHAWNAAFPDTPLEQQDVLLTVPASFDAVARDLTVQAAHDAGGWHELG